jgi:hypothetical protein
MCPAIIGEIGSPFDMKPTALLGMAQGKRHGFKDYVEPSKVSRFSYGDYDVLMSGHGLGAQRLWYVVPSVRICN